MVLIDGAGRRGLCAGGDIRLLYEGLTGTAAAPAEFWADEYGMNSTLAHYPKPIVAYMSGVTLGGGVGISGHCSVRIVTEILAGRHAGDGDRAVSRMSVGCTCCAARRASSARMPRSPARGSDPAMRSPRVWPIISCRPPTCAALTEHTAVRGGAVVARPDAAPAAELAADREWIDGATPVTMSSTIVQRTSGRAGGRGAGDGGGAGGDVADRAEGDAAGHPAGSVDDPGRGAGSGLPGRQPVPDRTPIWPRGSARRSSTRTAARAGTRPGWMR